MAVEFKEKSFTITIDTMGEPTEEWLELHNELCTVLTMLDTQEMCMPMPWRVIDLVRAMMPEWEDARKMYHKTSPQYENI